jgi:pimeloyl-ACP methyl ester carboxylesterase
MLSGAGLHREICLADPGQGSQKADSPDFGTGPDHLGKADAVIAPSYAHDFARRITGARLALIDGAGHLPHLERPDEVVPLVRDFPLPP